MGKKKKSKASKNAKGSRKKSENVLDGISGLPTDGLLLALLLQGKKQSLSFYYGSYLEYKESLQELRRKLQMIEISNYNTMKSIMKTSDEFTFELTDLSKGKNQFLESLNMDHDSLICLQRSEINELYKKVDELEASAEDLDNQLESIKQFQETNGFEELQKEMENAKKDAEEAKERRNKHLDKLSQRHEQSLFLSSQKAQRIIADMETVACKTEFAKLPPKTIEKMIQNRLLTHQIEETKKEEENLEFQIKKLEDLNIDYMFNGLEIDWNLIYNGNGQDDDCDYKFDYDDSASDGFNLLSDIGSLDESLEDERLISAFSLPKKSLMQERVYSIEKTAMKLTSLELEQRHKNITTSGMTGKQIDLRKPDLLDAGHLKFYDSKI